MPDSTWILIDNYDSFTHILHHYLVQTGHQCRIFRNDEVTVDELKKMNPSGLILSPGPGTPDDAGITLEAIKYFHKDVPILGVCLGHQALGIHFGARLRRADYPMHGKISVIKHEDHSLFDEVPLHFNAMRYHSLIIEQLEHTGLYSIAHATDDQAIMAVAHKEYPCIGIQFHPESVGTDFGKKIIENWVRLYAEKGKIKS